jgi:hypothetical protein
MNLSIIGMVEHRRVHGTRYMRGVVDRSLVAYTTAIVIDARAACEARSAARFRDRARVLRCVVVGWSRGAGYQAFPFRLAGLPNRPKAQTKPLAGKERA